MSRLQRFAHALSSGYLLIVGNVIFTLVSVPLALHYLGPAQFGLWAVVTQLAAYLQLIDFGMAGSLSRILIDHKDDTTSSTCGAVIQTGFRVLAVQGFLIALIGVIGSY